MKIKIKMSKNWKGYEYEMKMFGEGKMGICWLWGHEWWTIHTWLKKVIRNLVGTRSGIVYFYIFLVSPGTLQLRCGTCHPSPRRSRRCGRLWIRWRCNIKTWANLRRGTTPEKYWQRRSSNPSYRTKPMRGGWRCSRELSSCDQGTSAGRPLGWCSGRPLDMVMVIMIIKMGSLVKDGELTETPNSDFPHRRRNLAQGAV